jgi:electron transfer flavoprotein beta subunit
VRILVAVKQVAVPDDELELRPDRLDVDADTLDWRLNEWDSFAVEAALRLAEQDPGDVEVVVVTLGPERAEEALRAALAMGGDRAVHIVDEEPGFVDPIRVGRALAAVAAREAPDLVLCGAQSSDAMHGATGSALAGALGWTHVAVVRAIAGELSGGALEVEREVEGGLAQRLRVRLPALLTVQSGIHQPRYANLRALKQAALKPLERSSPADLRLGAGAPAARLVALRAPERARGASLVEGDPEQIAERIVELVEEGLRG